MNRRVLVAGLVVTLPLLWVLVANLGRDPHLVDSPLIGRPAPPFSLMPVGGGTAVSLEALRGRPLVLNFWATWCGPCLDEHAVLTRTARELRADVQFLGVIYEDEEAAVRRFLRSEGSSYPSLLDPQGKTAIAYGVYGVPETFFIDAGGTIVEKHARALDAEQLALSLRRAMQRPVAPGGGSR